MSVQEQERRARQREASVRYSSELKELAARHGVTVWTLYQERRKGRLRIKKIGARSIVTDEDERAWLDGLPTLSDAGRKPPGRKPRAAA
jgi:hypothetical protein